MFDVIEPKQAAEMLGNPICAILAIMKCALDDKQIEQMPRKEVEALVLKIPEKAKLGAYGGRESLATAAALLFYCSDDGDGYFVERDRATDLLKLTDIGEREAAEYLKSRGSSILHFFQQARDEIRAG